MEIDKKIPLSELSQSGEMYKSIFDNAPYSIVIFDFNGKILDVNLTTEVLFGIKSEELIGKNFLELNLYAPEVRPQIEERLERSNKGEEVEAIEVQITKPDGMKVWIRSKISRVQIGDRFVFQSVIQDVTSEKIAEEAILRSRRDWETIFNAIGHPTVILDPQHKILNANKAVIKMAGLSEEEIIGKKCYEIFHGSQTKTPPENCPMERMISSKSLETIDMEMETLGGGYLVSCTPVFDNERNLLKIIHLATDITARKRVEHKLKESEDLYRTFLKMSPDAITVGNLRGYIIDASEQTVKIHGYDKPEEIIGLSAFKLIDKKDHNRATQELLNTIGGQITGPVEFTLLKKDGTSFIGELKGGVLKDLSGRPKAVIISTRDITERKKAEYLLNQSKVITDNLREGIIQFNLEGLAEFVNPAYLKLTGYEYGEILKKNGLKIAKMTVADHEVDKIIGLFRRAVAGEIIPTQLTYLKHKTGREIPVEFEVSYIEDEKKNMLGIIVLIADISERTQSEEALRKSEAKYRQLVENISEVLYTVSEKGIVTYLSPAIEAIIGYKPSEIMGKSFVEFIYPTDLPRLLEGFQAVLSGQFTSNEYRLLAKSGEPRWVQTSSIPIYEDDKIVGLRGVITDINDRVAAGHQLRESELKYRHLFEKSPFANVLINMRGDIIDCNSMVDSIFGYSKEDILGKNFFDLNIIPPEYLELTINHFSNIVQKRLTVPFELQIKNKEGTLIWVYAEGSFIELDEKSVVQVIAQDVTERKIAEQKIKDSEENYRLITENSNDLIVVVTQNRGIEYVNETASLRLLNYTLNDLKNLKMQGIFHPDDFPTLIETFKEAFDKGSAKAELRMRRKDGEYIWLESLARIFYLDSGGMRVLIVSREISERKALEESRKNYMQDLEKEVEKKTLELKLEKEELQKALENLETTQQYLIQSEKLASIGLLAAGMAHEINNPLMGIINYAQIIKDELENNEKIEINEKPYSFLESLIKEGERIAEIVHGLLTFAREDKGQFIFADMREIINSALALLIPKIKRSQIDIQLEYDDKVPVIPMQTRNMRQVILNVIQNSIDALDTKFGKLAAKGSKQILIKTSLVEIDSRKYGKVIIKDNGEGIMQKDIGKVFDPFFSTKLGADEHGLGLGLSISYGTIKDHGGDIQIKSVWKEYTIVEIILPLEKNQVPKFSEEMDENG